MFPILLHLGPITIYSFGLMMALAFIVGDLVVASEFKRNGYSVDQASTLVLWVALAGLVGSRLYDVIDNWGAYRSDPKSILLSGSGFVFYGGFVAGLITSWIIARRFGIRWLKLTDMSVAALAIGHGIGRIGCLLSGDGDWGTVTTLPWGMQFPRAIIGWNSQTVLALDSHNALVSAYYPGVRVHPAPLYETILYTGVFLILWSFGKKNQVEGRVLYLYLMLVGACRFVVEFVRINPRIVLGLSEAQLISTAMIMIGALGWLMSAAGQPILTARGAARA
jgi:phosphatidylglycerol:prolipoprotein diacylglycerol transferase